MGLYLIFVIYIKHIMKNFNIVSILLLAIFVSSCSNKEPESIKIQENDSCILNHPSLITKANDSSIFIIDRTQVLEINIFSGMMRNVNYDGISKAFAEYLASMNGQEITDSTPITPLSLLGFGDKTDKMLFAYPMQTIDTAGFMNIVPATVYCNTKEFKVLFDEPEQGSIVTNIPQGNFSYFLSDSIILTNCYSQYEKSKKPEQIPTITLFEKDKIGEFAQKSIIEMPRCEKENTAAETNVMNSVYTYVPTPNYFAYDGKIYVSMAGCIFEISKSGETTKITDGTRIIYTFKIEDGIITTVEGSLDYISKIVEYNLENGKMKKEKDFPNFGIKKCECCKYIDGELYVIFNKEGKFYLSII